MCRWALLCPKADQRDSSSALFYTEASYWLSISVSVREVMLYEVQILTMYS